MYRINSKRNPKFMYFLVKIRKKRDRSKEGVQIFGENKISFRFYLGSLLEVGRRTGSCVPKENMFEKKGR